MTTGLDDGDVYCSEEIRDAVETALGPEENGRSESMCFYCTFFKFNAFQPGSFGPIPVWKFSTFPKKTGSVWAEVSFETTKKDFLELFSGKPISGFELSTEPDGLRVGSWHGDACVSVEESSGIYAVKIGIVCVE